MRKITRFAILLAMSAMSGATLAQTSSGASNPGSDASYTVTLPNGDAFTYFGPEATVVGANFDLGSVVLKTASGDYIVKPLNGVGYSSGGSLDFLSSSGYSSTSGTSGSSGSSSGLSTSSFGTTSGNPGDLHSITLPNGQQYSYSGSVPPTVDLDPNTGAITVRLADGRTTIFNPDGTSSSTSSGGDPGNLGGGSGGASVPEPGLAGLFLIGAAGLIGLGRRRRNR